MSYVLCPMSYVRSSLLVLYYSFFYFFTNKKIDIISSVLPTNNKNACYLLYIKNNKKQKQYQYQITIKSSLWESRI